MNSKAMIPLVLAVVLGLVAAVLVRNAMVRRAAVPQPVSNLVSVVVAAHDMTPGTQIGKEDLLISKVPAESTPGQVYSDPNALAGRVTTTTIVKGQTILETLLAPHGTGSGLQALVPPGKRAITLEVNEFTAVGGMLVPGCHIDVLGVIRDEKTKEAVARTMLQDLTITAVGRSTTPGATGHDANGQPLPPSNHITLLCTPKEAQQLHLIMAMGKPWLALRNSRDDAPVNEENTTFAELRGDVDSSNGNDPFVLSKPSPDVLPAPLPPDVPATLVQTTQPAVNDTPQPVRRVVQILRGSTESQVVFTLPAVSRRLTVENDNSPAFIH